MSESVKVGTVEYPIDPETAKRLREGEIPSELKSRITLQSDLGKEKFLPN